MFNKARLFFNKARLFFNKGALLCDRGCLLLTHCNAIIAELADGLAVGDEEHGLIGIGGEKTVVEFTLGGFIE